MFFPSSQNLTHHGQLYVQKKTKKTVPRNQNMILHDELSAILESGFSLSEQEHEAADIPIIATCANMAIADTNTTMASVILDSIEGLRQRILDDVVGQETSNEGISQVTAVTVPRTVATVATVTSPIEFQPGKPATLPLVYCDFTASHRPLKSIESYLTEKCLPLYGNTHTNTSLTGSQSTAFCSEARQIVAEACGAKTTGKASQDVVLFA